MIIGVDKDIYLSYKLIKLNNIFYHLQHNGTDTYKDFIKEKPFILKNHNIIMSGKKCVICNEAISEEFGKLSGTIVKVVDEKKKSQHLHVCSSCQKTDNWIEKAKIKGA
jgi:hypothetical protein